MWAPPIPKGLCPLCSKPIDNGRHTFLGRSGGGQTDDGMPYVETQWRCDDQPTDPIKEPTS
ncbi:MAG TPA: hypothetical protein VJN18_32625 [Polyangiaceae bacterium]|nr:hypothetical protein [Polyangiaceae bacterium]